MACRRRMEILKFFFMNISRTLRLLSLLTAMTVFSAAGMAGATAPAPAAEKAPAVVWIDGATQKAVSTAEMLDGLKEYQVIFFGEFHDIRRRKFVCGICHEERYCLKKCSKNVKNILFSSMLYIF